MSEEQKFIIRLRALIAHYDRRRDKDHEFSAGDYFELMSAIKFMLSQLPEKRTIKQRRAVELVQKWLAEDSDTDDRYDELIDLIDGVQ